MRLQCCMCLETVEELTYFDDEGFPEEDLDKQCGDGYCDKCVEEWL